MVDERANTSMTYSNTATASAFWSTAAFRQICFYSQQIRIWSSSATFSGTISPDPPPKSKSFERGAVNWLPSRHDKSYNG